MTAKTKKILQIYLFIALVFAIVLTALRTVALFYGYEPGVGYYSVNAPCFSEYRILAYVAFFVLLSSLFTLRQKIPDLEPIGGIPVIFSVSLFGVLLFAFSLFRIFELDLSSVSSRLSAGTVSVQILFCAFGASIFGILASLSSVFSVARRQSLNPVRAFGAMATSLSLLFYGVYLYFEFSLPLNSDVKMEQQACFLIAAVYFLSEARIAVGRPFWTGYISSGTILFVFAFPVSISNLIYSLVKGNSVFDSPIGDFLLFAVSIYIICHLSSLFAISEKTDIGPIAYILNEKEEVKEEPYYGTAEQISFFDSEWKLPETTPVVRNDVDENAPAVNEADIFDLPGLNAKEEEQLSHEDVNVPLSVLAMKDEAIPFPDQIAVEIPMDTEEESSDNGEETSDNGEETSLSSEEAQEESETIRVAEESSDNVQSSEEFVKTEAVDEFDSKTDVTEAVESDSDNEDLFSAPDDLEEGTDK